MTRKYCKYCKQRDHSIDECKTISCRGCGERGHPTWHCPKQQQRPKSVLNRRQPKVQQRRPTPVQAKIPEWPAPRPVAPKPTAASLWDFTSRRTELWADM